MKIAYSVFFGFHVLCSVRVAAFASTTELTNEAFTATEDDLFATESDENISYLNLTEANIDLSKSKINDSEIFENGQTAKEEHQRSFIYIQNIKSRLPWRPKMPGLFFVDDFRNAKAVLRGGNDKTKPFKTVPQPVRNSYYRETTTAQNLRGSNNQNKYFSGNIRAEIDGKRPYVPYNDRAMPASRPQPKLRPPPPIIRQQIEQKANKTVRFPYQRVNHYKSPYPSPVPTTVTIPTVLYENKNPEQINKYSPHSEGINESHFNCFNKDCAIRSKNYRVNMNNGIMRGMSCVCQNVPMFNNNRQAQDMYNSNRQVQDIYNSNRQIQDMFNSNRQIQDWRARKKPLTASEQAYIRALNTNNTDDYSYEQLLKEMKKLTRIVDGIE
ncbi:uncharacterized protein LOC134673284 [Cydia fagiglandana]|uniref:uncharacterized protein LOC134673284 n=1 Tax=Cydia fagiglandana TaxID=1458189 RepID=UPI002FEE182D